MQDNDSRVRSVLEKVLDESARQREFAACGDIVEAIRCQIKRDELFTELASLGMGRSAIGPMMDIVDSIAANDASTAAMLEGALADTADKLKRLRTGMAARNAYAAHQGREYSPEP